MNMLNAAFSRGTACDRARERASCELDDELSEFDRYLLARHLDRCDDCRGFLANAAFVTRILRGAPLDAYEVGRVVPPKARLARARQLAPVAAAVLLLTTAATTLVAGGKRNHPVITTPVSVPKIAPIASRTAGVAAQPVVKLPIGQKSAAADF
jgi:predicted anti-sigma-YlaC factor YlaD